VDAQAVGQILLNLVENACRYGRSDEKPLIRLAIERRGDRVEVRVRDFGPGVPADLARRIFLPFERGASSDPARGLGMGLPLSRDFARELGGDLYLERPDDGGACFVVSLPVAPA
jgi:two-component system sensor histidine kinase KdpD